MAQLTEKVTIIPSFGQTLLALSKKHQLTDLIANLNIRLEELTIAGVVMPCSVNDRASSSAWTVSIYATAIDYAKDELTKLPKRQRHVMGVIRSVAGLVFRLVNLDQIVGINNDCISTNLMSAEFHKTDFRILTTQAVARYPHHALMIRSLNPHYHAKILHQLSDAGWDHLVNREIYLIDDPELALKRNNSKKDTKLLSDGTYRFRQLTPNSPAHDYQEAERLYNLLYLDKYSQSNVQFKALLLQELVQANAMTLFLLEDAISNQAHGCIGMIQQEETLTVPLLGYDTSLPLEKALYRRLCIFITHYCANHDLKIHRSSGVSAFKLSRGATAHLEYVAVYSKHLSASRRLVWSLLRRITNKLYAQILVNNEL